MPHGMSRSEDEWGEFADVESRTGEYPTPPWGEDTIALQAAYRLEPGQWTLVMIRKVAVSLSFDSEGSNDSFPQWYAETDRWGFHGNSPLDAILGVLGEHIERMEEEG